MLKLVANSWLQPYFLLLVQIFDNIVQERSLFPYILHKKNLLKFLLQSFFQYAKPLFQGSTIKPQELR